MQLISKCHRIWLLLPLLGLIGCINNSNVQSQAVDSSLGLKDYYQQYFPIGVSVKPEELQGASAALITRHFNSITAVNAMKMGNLQPREGEFYWNDADSLVAFAARHNMRVRGHTLIWHQEVPEWFFLDENGGRASRELVLRRMKAHITAVVTRYKGKIYAWDVVNEAISNSKDELYRPTPFLEICGEDYIARAFEWAHEADRNALLFYNDYNETDPIKREKIIHLVRSLRIKGVPLHGIGLQCHWNIFEPAEKDIEVMLQDFGKLKIPIQITELDISIHPSPTQEQKLRLGVDTALTPKKTARQEDQFQKAFRLFRKYRHFISGVTFWNVSDRHSWLNNFPVKGRNDYPLLFDTMLQPKNAFWKVALFQKEHE